MNPIADIQALVEQAVGKLWSDLASLQADVNHSPKPEFGDYSSPIALSIGKQLGINPQEVAEKIKQKIS